ncbi:MAG TPA: THUMP domain-containing protein, partial [Chloroflexota bacterium]|nr:THUMP domain-containing protein [Chloroflexota bacterium]
MLVLSERALERRLKRHLMKEAHSFFTPCAPGFEDVLKREVEALPQVTLHDGERGGVSFSGPLDTVYHANLQLRTAHRVLLRIDDFLAQSYPALFDRVSRVPWELYLGFNKQYSLRVSAKTSRLRHHKNIAKTVHDGICKAVEPLGLSPTLQDEATLEIQVRLFQDRCSLSLDTSGEHLHKRGYRT